MEDAIQYRTLREGEISLALLQSFIRRQVVTKCLRRAAGRWVIRDDPFVDDWTKEEYAYLVTCLKRTAHTGGLVYAAFQKNELKGFVSVEPELFGGEQKYLDLSSIHVSADLRGKGVGRQLFEAAKNWARAHGGRKLYISAHSAVETQAFYKAMGCGEAQVYLQKHVEAEPFDCQLEYILED